MNKKVIALINQDEQIKEACKVIQRAEDNFREQILFNRKQCDNALDRAQKNYEEIVDKHSKTSKEHWKVLEEKLKEKGLISENEFDGSNLGFDMNENTIYIVEAKEIEKIKSFENLEIQVFQGDQIQDFINQLLEKQRAQAEQIKIQQELKELKQKRAEDERLQKRLIQERIFFDREKNKGFKGFLRRILKL